MSPIYEIRPLCDMAVNRNLVVVYDCESDGRPRRDDNGGADFGKVQATCVCAFAVEETVIRNAQSLHAILAGGTWHTFWRDVAKSRSTGPFDGLLELFDVATLIIAYNCLDFDFPLLHKHYAIGRSDQRYLQHRMKTLDVFSRIRSLSGVWPKLDELLKSNGIESKSADGAAAVEMWNDGRRAELEKYCQLDVQRTLELSLVPTKLICRGVNYPPHIYHVLPALDVAKLINRAQP